MFENQSRLIFPVAAYPQDVFDCHAEQVALVRMQQTTLLEANKAILQLVELESAESPNNRSFLSEKARLTVDISQGEYDLHAELPIHMNESEKNE